MTVQGLKTHFYLDEVVSILELDRKVMREVRSHMQVIFQDPFSSLNERMTVLENVGEALVNNGVASGKDLENRSSF